jgi:tripartite-type tricarboxylate transporter receptor subunit TctC
VKVIHTPELQKRITELGYEPLGSTPREMADRIRRETVEWTRIIKQADITLD